MTQHTAAEFAASRFATHPDGRIAARIDPGDDRPWRAGGYPIWISDENMARDGWSPLGETLPRVVTDEMVEASAERFRGLPTAMSARDRARVMLTAALSAAPTTDEDGTDFAALWKETARHLAKQVAEVRDFQKATQANFDYVVRQRDEAHASAQAAVEQWNTMTAREHLDAAWEAAHVPADGVIPAGAEFIRRWRSGGDTTYGTSLATEREQRDTGWNIELRLLDPPTPTRPDGAEAIEAYMRELVASHPEDHYGELADHLASRGVLPPLTDKSEPRRGVRAPEKENDR